MENITQEEKMPWKTFEKELADLINRHSMENGSNTPDYILARYLLQCLMAYESLNRSKEEWFSPKKENKEI